MSTHLRPPQPRIIYPDSDGEPMADNTLQFEWIVKIKEGLSDQFRDDPEVFVAGDLLWYPVEGHPEICAAPDAMVAFGRPKGYRGSYKQWEEGGIAPQVVFEVLSPRNRPRDLIRKFQFYDRYGPEEYYFYDPDHILLEGWLRRDGVLTVIPETNGWVSPRLGIRFELGEETLTILRPDGRPLLSYEEQSRRGDEAERQRAEADRQRAEAERRHAEAEQTAERLAAQLRALGIEPTS